MNATAGHDDTRMTVLMPVRNAATTVLSAARSTLNALPANAQLFIHDDASSDTTPEMLERLRDHRVRVVRSETPRGVAGGLNHLLELVDSGVVGRMDADDICLPWRFRVQGRALRGGADVVFSTVVGMVGAGPLALRPGPPLPLSTSAFPLHLLLSNPVAHSTMLARTEVIREAGGYRPVPAEDYDLWLRLADRGARFTRTAVPGILYRFHPGQLTASPEWTARFKADPAIRDAYGALSRSILGRSPVWYEALHDPTGPDIEPAQLQDFTAAMKVAASQLSSLQRRALLRKLKHLTTRPESE